VREELPDGPPYHAWSNVEFVALDGTPHEVDLVVLRPAGFHVVELVPLTRPRYRVQGWSQVGSVSPGWWHASGRVVEEEDGTLFSV
jgi:hypothetical protein